MCERKKRQLLNLIEVLLEDIEKNKDEWNLPTDDSDTREVEAWNSVLAIQTKQLNDIVNNVRKMYENDETYELLGGVRVQEMMSFTQLYLPARKLYAFVKHDIEYEENIELKWLKNRYEELGMWQKKLEKDIKGVPNREEWDDFTQMMEATLENIQTKINELEELSKRGLDL